MRMKFYKVIRTYGRQEKGSFVPRPRISKEIKILTITDIAKSAIHAAVIFMC